jgi:hypothetical protein
LSVSLLLPFFFLPSFSRSELQSMGPSNNERPHCLYHSNYQSSQYGQKRQRRRQE